MEYENAKEGIQMAKKYASDNKVTSSKQLVVIDPNKPEKVVMAGNVRARVWKNDSPVGVEWRVDCVYIYSVSNRGNNRNWGTTHSIPLHAVPDAARAMKKAYRWAKRRRRNERWFAIILLRW